MGTNHGLDGGGGHLSDPREERGRDDGAGSGGPPGVCGLYNLGMFTTLMMRCGV
jgi:hypothetical protein